MTKGQGWQGSGSPPPPSPRPAQPLDPYGARFTWPNTVNLSIGFMLLMVIMSGVGATVSPDSCKSQGVLFISTFTPTGCICYLLIGNDAVSMSNSVQRSAGNFEGARTHAHRLQVEVMSEIYASTSDTAEGDPSKAVACKTDENFPGSAEIADRIDIQLIFHKDQRSETAKRICTVTVDPGIVNICSANWYTTNTVVLANRRNRLPPSTF